MTRIGQVIIQGIIKNPEDYRITSGNRWLESLDNLRVVHPELNNRNISFVINWRNGRIARWDHDFELSADWHLSNVSITYIDQRGNNILSVIPEDFRFHYNISRDGVIKNWKAHKKGFISIMKWSLDNIVE